MSCPKETEKTKRGLQFFSTISDPILFILLDNESSFIIYVILNALSNVVAICDLVHDVETIFHISYVLTASENLFLKYE